MSRTLSLREIYRWPTAIALVIVTGLLSALFGDGVWDAFSWLLLVIPLLLLLIFLYRK